MGVAPSCSHTSDCRRSCSKILDPATDTVKVNLAGLAVTRRPSKGGEDLEEVFTPIAATGALPTGPAAEDPPLFLGAAGEGWQCPGSARAPSTAEEARFQEGRPPPALWAETPEELDRRLLAEAEQNWQEDLRAAEEERCRLEAEEQEERRRAEEALAAKQEEALAAEQVRRVDEELSALREREARVASFLAEHKFSSVCGKRWKLMAVTYPLHTAAKKGDAEIATDLLQSGADPMQKDSAGKTAAQVAQRCNRKGSHAAVLRVLGAATVSPAAAAGA
eukprot:gnl/TRDRNA2_/TRDRNA2_92239_c0_seq1.p1 gnl/TRDRNA2_/TRDRNA2_92239_c0~~gnl/TRDRNA2_/TRDRNA2_92239_c0_seq1.p1  ORF type:complete len:295 (-),score=66.87 gnl/TRDRNA2_/TRDRNA2_92239_c0_seq1:30-863(-)